MALELLETNIVLDVYDHDGERPSIKSIALDDNTRYVFARLTYQGNTYDIGSTATVRLVIIRPDKVGTKIIGEPKEIQMGQADESIVTVYGAYAELVQPAIAVAGTLFGQFIITYGDQILRSQIFAINNGEALDADEWAGEYDGYSGIDELVAKVDAVVAKVDGMETDVSDLKNSIRMATVNIAGMVGWELTSENIAEAISLALAKSSYIYIPSGEYSFNAEITSDCTIYLDEQCFISSATADPIIHAQNCSINLIGGNILNGEDDNSRVALANRNGLIYFEGCHDSSIVGLNSPYSKSNGVIWIKDCENFVLERSTFDRMLRAAMFVCGHCVNVAVRNCKFANSVPLNGQDYCYFVYTGSSLLTDNFIPVDGLVYENNYCSGSEDCGLDTHGARNVIIRNNIVLDTVCAITAYNDNKRVTRPVGWKMENILIENNYCDSTRQNAQGRSYPHPFLFIGASNNETALYDEFRNCTVRNNTFRTANNFEFGAIFNNVVSRNLVYENNTFKFYDGAVSPITFRSSFGSAFRNNRLEDGSATVYFKHFLGEVSGNVGFTYNWDDDFVSYVKGLNNIFPEIVSPTYRTGDVFWSNGLQICTSYGICARVQYDAKFKTFSITVADGVATVSNGVDGVAKNVYIPHLALTLSGSGSAYIKDVIDATRFTLVDANKTPVADGTYTATINDVTMASLA